MAFPYSSGDVLTAADLNNFPGLVYISTKTVTTGTYVEWNGDIDGTYFDNYRIVGHIDNITGASNILGRVMSSGTPVTTSTYLWSGYLSYTGSAIMPAYQGGGATSAWRISVSDGSSVYGNLPFTCELLSLPHASVASSFTATGFNPVTPFPYTSQTAGTRTAVGAHDGFRLFLDGAVTADITASLYGYNK
jgi:hypothetical protein